MPILPVIEDLLESPAPNINVQEIDAELARIGTLYHAAESARVAAEAAYKSVKDTADSYKEQLQALAVKRTEATGEKTWNFVQCATSTDVDYDPGEMYSWALNAPRELQRRLLRLDKDAAKVFLLERLQEDDTFRSVEFMPPLIALKKTRQTGKVLAKELTLFLKGAAPAAPEPRIVDAQPLVSITPQPSANITSFLTAPELKPAAGQNERGKIEADDIPF